MKVQHPAPSISPYIACPAGLPQSTVERAEDLREEFRRRAKTRVIKPMPTVENALRMEVEGQLTSAMESNDYDAFERALTRWSPEWDKSSLRPGLTPLMLSLNKNAYFTKRLLQMGSSLRPHVALGPDTGLSPVMYGIRTGASFARLQLLIQPLKKLYQKTLSGETTLAAAIKAGRNDIVQLLFHRGAAWSIPYGFLVPGGEDMEHYIQLAKQCGQHAIEDTLRNPPKIDGDVWTERTFGSEVIGSLGIDMTGDVRPHV